MSTPVPSSISVTLPVGQVATCTAVSGETFQPDRVCWVADEGHVVAWAHGRTGYCAMGIESEPWCPQPPEWFKNEAARMALWAKAADEQDRAEDVKADATMGLA